MIYSLSAAMKDNFKRLLGRFLCYLTSLRDGHSDEVFASRIQSDSSSFRLRRPLQIYFPENLFLGQGVDIGEFSVIRANASVHIGKNVLIASHTVISTVGHPKSHPRRGITISHPITIEDEVWLGAGSIILPGVTIGYGSIVAAGAVVTRNVPRGVVVAGVPARVISIIHE